MVEPLKIRWRDWWANGPTDGSTQASGDLKIKTRAGYASLLTTKIIPKFGNTPLSTVKPIKVAEWISDLRHLGLSASRVRQSYRLLSQIMTAAVENDLIATSPCRGVRLPRMPQTEPHILSEQEADRIIDAIGGPTDLLVELLAYGGAPRTSIRL